MEEPSGRQIVGRSEDSGEPGEVIVIPENPEQPETTTTWDMEEPSGRQIVGSSEDTDESEKFIFITEIPEQPETTTTLDKVELSEISSETSEDTQSLEEQTNGQSVPLNRLIGALLPPQTVYIFTSLLVISCVWSLFGFPASQSHEEDPASFGGKIKKIRKIIRSTRSCTWKNLRGSQTVGIFSMSSESDYEWLINQLKSKSFHKTVSTVLPHYISNNGWRQFREAVSRCTFGILYHTKNRGRINIVGVNGSVYDEELRYLCERLGKENVIVVVDDVEDASDEQKTRILEEQPSIGSLAKDLFLFSANEKLTMTSGESTRES